MFSQKRKRLIVLYDEACKQFVDRRKMLKAIANGKDPHGDFINFFEETKDSDLVDAEYADRSWRDKKEFVQYEQLSDKYLEAFIDMLMKNLTCETD